MPRQIYHESSGFNGGCQVGPRRATQARRGDMECGYFLAELIPMFWKTRANRSANVNEMFRKYLETPLNWLTFPRQEDSH